MRNRDLTNQVFGRWTVLSKVQAPPGVKAKWLCRCSCGKEGAVFQNNLVSSISKSCGCLNLELVAARNLKHGFGAEPLAQVWRDIKKRCYNPNHGSYKDYGGRGIKLADCWHDYEVFRADVGHSPGKGYSLDRVNNDGDYAPGNVRWATWEEQATNKRSSRFLTHQGLTLTVSQWARGLGVPKSRILYRLRQGHSTESVLNPNKLAASNQFISKGRADSRA